MIQDARGRDFAYISDGKSYRLTSEGPPKLVATDSNKEILEVTP